MYKRFIALIISVIVLSSLTMTTYALGSITITFRFQGGSGGTSEVHLQSQNTALPNIIVPTRKGYNFIGYFTEPAGKGTQYYSNAGKPVVSQSTQTNTSLYAYWKNAVYTITYENIEGAVLAQLPASHTYGAETIIPTPTKEGYTFFGWQLNHSAVSQKDLVLGSYNLTKNITLTAVWNKARLVTSKNNSTQTVRFLDSDLQKIFDSQVADPEKGITANDLNSESVEIIMTASDANDQSEGAADVIALAQGDVMSLYDFSIYKKVTKLNESPVTTNLNEIPTTVQVDITLSDKLSAKTGYRVYRYHGGQAQAIPLEPINSSSMQQEYFTISEDGKTLSLHTMRLSTYAVVANTKSIGDTNVGSDVDVQAKVVVSSFGAVYKVDIVWGEMKFYYSKDAIWNPDIHEYDEKSRFEWIERLSYDSGNNRIKVYNHSNADVMIDMYITGNQLEGVDIQMFTTNEPSGIVAEQMLISRVPQELAPANAVEGYLRLSGTPENWETLDAQTGNNGFTRIAGITVTVTNLDTPLTPKK